MRIARSGEASSISVTSDGKRLAFFRQAVEPDVYVIDLEVNGNRLSTPRRLTLDESADYPYSWSPASKSVIFTSDRNGTFNIFRQGMHDADWAVIEAQLRNALRITATPTTHMYLGLTLYHLQNNAEAEKELKAAIETGTVRAPKH